MKRRRPPKHSDTAKRQADARVPSTHLMYTPRQSEENRLSVEEEERRTGGGGEEEERRRRRRRRRRMK